MPAKSPRRRLRTCSLAIVAIAFAVNGWPADPPPPAKADVSQKTGLQYGIEWRLIRAGVAKLNWSPQSGGFQSDLHLESSGLVSKLHKVNDRYIVNMNGELCATSVTIDAKEGSRHRDTRIQFDGAAGKANYVERDVLKNSVVLTKETKTPPCVHEYIGGLNRMRSLGLQPGQAASVPLSNGKKFANVKVEAQEREDVRTPLGSFKTVRYEVHMFNDVLVQKNARLFVWLTDDARKLPVQIRVRMQFLIGTITLQLEKEERL